MSRKLAAPAAVTFAVAALLLLPARDHEAAAQSPPFYVNAVDIDVVPASFEKFMAALKDNAAATIKEPGCRELDITVSQKYPHHVFVFEVYNNAAAWNSHQTTAHFLKFYGFTAQMMTRLDLRPFSSVAMNGGAAALSGPLLINVVDLDIVPAQFDAFMAASKDNAAATVKEPGGHEFNISVLQKDPHHALFFAVFDDAAAIEAHQATDRYKAYQASTKNMVAKRELRQVSSVAMFAKGQ
jgi:autoinducer 2-degrading protein